MKSENKYIIKEKEIKVVMTSELDVHCVIIVDGKDFVISIELLKLIAEPTP